MHGFPACLYAHLFDCQVDLELENAKRTVEELTQQNDEWRSAMETLTEEVIGIRAVVEDKDKVIQQTQGSMARIMVEAQMQRDREINQVRAKAQRALSLMQHL